MCVLACDSPDPNWGNSSCMTLEDGGSYNGRAFASQEFGVHLRARLQPGNARVAAERAARDTFYDVSDGRVT